MIDYQSMGQLPAKHHIALRRGDDEPGDGCPVFYEHCVTRGGFDGPYSILYRRNNPGAEGARETVDLPVFSGKGFAGGLLRRHHFPTPGVAGGGALWQSVRWLVGNVDVRVGTAQPTESDSGLVQNGDGDLLLFMHEGAGVLDSEMGRLPFRRHDYVWIPKGVIHRIQFNDGPVHVMVMECAAGLQMPDNFTNPLGQLRMDAPFCHRDFRRPEALSEPEGEAVVLNKRGDAWTRREMPHHPFDVVGWDGTVYPVAFNVHDYQPKTGLVHLPPPIHTTFVGGNGSFVVCSFVPRKVDYHPDAIPCPYPHSSVDCDEVLWYVEGEFTSRKGVGAGSISLHPAGIPHAPQPGRYEASMGTTRSDELAVMLDTFKPLLLSDDAVACDDLDYHESWSRSGSADA